MLAFLIRPALGALVVVSGLIGCGVYGGLTTVRGSGNVITETRNVSGFNGVELTGFGNLKITQGETEGLTITADDNIIPYIKTEVVNGVLTIGFTSPILTVGPTRGINYDLQAKDLNSIKLSGAGNGTAAALSSDNLSLALSGAGNMDIGQLDATNFDVSMSGAGNVTVAGEVQSQDVSMSGLGNYTAGDLKSSNTTISMSGAGNATVWADQTLDIRMSGAGNLSYYGSPQVTQSTSGLGRVSSLGSK
jgi:hypothetical protein